ncbi:MAG: 2-oxoacid:acceptor oxidoreductase subunit alpha [Planctomycetes bacterium]|nr:2-oxoacid:acceptor oxidoreductase subunit alpha [Planctomycetota bacterium]
MSSKPIEERASVVIRFAGDSGDGMQLAGSLFAAASALAGNDISNFPDYPAEIRAPAGTLSGVSGFQVHFASEDVHTPGDEVDALFAMNPAALKVHQADLREGGILVANSDAFTEQNLRKAGYAGGNPLQEGGLRSRFSVHEVPISSLNRAAVEGIENLSTREIDRTRNFFALGLAAWMFGRPLQPTLDWIANKFEKRPEIAEANARALRAGYHFGETAEVLDANIRVSPAPAPPGVYRTLAGNEAAALGLIAAAQRAGKTLFYGSYPITPASDILHELSRHAAFDVRTFQAEDEIAAIGAAIGASFGGALGATGTSGPGLCLKSEALNLAVMLEIPLVVISVQRGGPSTGLPTKVEQSDLLQALYGRNGESPVPVVAPATPGDCFAMAIEAVRIAFRYMTPVLYLSDSYLANGAEPWRVPRVEDLPEISVVHRTNPEGFLPYARDPETLARPWVLPGTPGLEHRIGGLEKQDGTGAVSYDPANHEKMCRLRAEKVARIVEDSPPLTVAGPESGKLLVIGWGSTYGAIRAALEPLWAQGKPVAQAHLRYLNPFPANLGEVLSRFKRILVPELNLGQLRTVLRSQYLVDAIGLAKVQGKPFAAREIRSRVLELLEA